MHRIKVSLVLTAAQVRDYYRGALQYVVARAANGQMVQMPIRILHRQIRSEGIRGEFVVVTDDQYKFQRLEASAVPGAEDARG